MLPACWKNNRLEKSVVQIYTKNSLQKWLVKMVRSPKLVSSPKKKFHMGIKSKIISATFLISVNADRPQQPYNYKTINNQKL
jgi:hypothetical protein